LPHLLFLNEFFHPDICASAVVAADHLPKIAALRPDWKITVIAGNRAWDDPSRIYSAEEDWQGIHIVRVNRPAVSRTSLIMRGLGFAAFERAALRAAAKLGKIDLVVGTTAPPQGGRIAAKIASRAGCPYIYKVLDLYPDTAVTLGRLNEGAFIHRRWLTADTRLMQDAAAVVAISTPITERIARTRGIDPGKLHTIHDGFDPARLAFDGPNEFAAEYNPAGKFIVQYAGNMGLSHPLGTILEAAKALQGDPTIRFQFVGDGPQRRGLEKHLPPNAQLIGYQPAERLGQVLAAADVCLISQHEEMFDQALPYKIYAVLAAGKPCIFIGSDRSEIAGWLTKSGAGCVTPHGQTAALMDCIHAFRALGRRQSSAAAARKMFLARFRSDRVVATWAPVLTGVLAGQRHSP
jgi:glycosyltransferase involved in cell wall biosynthesis